jgi:protein SCO1
MPTPDHSTMSRLRALWPLLLLLAFGVATLGAATWLTLGPQRQNDAGAIGGPFTLQASTGGMLGDRDMVGAPYVVFFGFTHCPDVCPTALMQLSQVLEAAGAKGKALKVLFISVDPARDTREVLANYLGSFDPRIVGLTGTDAEITSVARAFKAYARKVPQANGDYTMDHSTFLYLFDRRGRFVSSFNIEQPPAAAAAEWLRLM